MLYPKRDYMAVISVNETTATHIKTDHWKVNELAALEFTYVMGTEAKASVRVSVFS